MGNDQKQKISSQVFEMKMDIINTSYEKAKELFIQIKLELSQIKKEDDINEIANFLIENHTDKKVGVEFLDLISNLRPEDKLGYLIQLIYENELIESIDKSVENNNFIQGLIKLVKRDKKDFEKTKEEIDKKMKKITQVNNYLEFLHFKSIMFEKIAEEYYNLGSIMYSSYGTKKIQLSTDLQDIVDLFTQCVENYKNTSNQRIKLEEYTSALEKVTAHQYILKGKELIKDEKFEEALEYLNKVNYQNSEMIEERDKGVHLCYQKMAELEEEKENYEKAIEYYEKIDNFFKVYELKIILNRHKIIEYIKIKKYDKTIEYFNNIFVLVNKAKNREFVELKFSKIYEIFIDLIILLAILSYQKGSLKNYIGIIDQLKDSIENGGINSEVKELLIELNKLENSNEKKNFENITKSVTSNNSEIKQKFYLSLLVIQYLKVKPEILKILLGKNINLSYLNTKSCEILAEYLHEKNNINDLIMITELFYKIIVNNGKYQRIEIYRIIGNKIKEILPIPNEENDRNYSKVMEYLILSFQEILINNSKINQYEGPKKILSDLILKYNKFITTIAKSFLFFSINEIKLENSLIEIIITYLINNDNDTLLDTLFIQFDLNSENILNYLDSIYKIIFNYHKINIRNKKEKIEKIFNFLLSLPEKIISSNISVQNLEKYITENEINPLCYKIIEKIPIRFRSIKLSQKLEFFKEQKKNDPINKDNEDIKVQYHFMSTITKEDLPYFEKNLDDTDNVKKLIDYLNKQKDLFQYLNIEEISKHFSCETKELFNLLVANKVIFNKKALINLLKGFYKNSEQEIAETFEIYNKIKEYQNKFPLIIEKNLEIEEFLAYKKYKNYQSFNIKLNQIFDDFSYLNGFAIQHQNFIIHFYNLSDKDKRYIILTKMIQFLTEKNYDIGPIIYQKVLDKVHSPEFINIIQRVLVSKKISNVIKEMTMKQLEIILVRTQNKLNLVKSFKTFIDHVELTNKILEYLISLLFQDNINLEMYKEIIFIFCNYFSIKVKQEESFNILIAIISEKELYKFIVNNIKSVTDQKEIIYLYGCLNYINFNINSKNEREVLQIPVNNIENIIKSYNANFDIELFRENLESFNQHYKCDIFNPKRDKILRKLFFNYENNSSNLLLN